MVVLATEHVKLQNDVSSSGLVDPPEISGGGKAWVVSLNSRVTREAMNEEVLH